MPLSQLAEEDRRRRRRRWIVWPALAGLLALAVVAAWLLSRPRPVAIAARFRAQPATHGDVRREVRATGHVEAVSTVSVGAEVSGRIAAVDVDFNDHVKKGQVLARFDRSALVAQRSQAVANFTAARAQVANARFDLDKALRDLNRADALAVRNAIAAQEHDAATTAARLAASRMHVAEAQLEAQEAAYALTNTNFDHATIRAPIDGVIITRNIDPGQTVASVLQTPVLFTVAADLRKMRIIAAVDEADIGEVVTGQAVISTVSGYPDRVFEGVVTEVRNAATIVQDVVTYGVVVTIANPDLALRPGMTANVRIEVARATGVDRVPNAALHFTPPGEARGSTSEVWVLAGKAVHRVPITAGVSDGELVAVGAGSELVPGAMVLTELTTAGKLVYGNEHRP